MATRRLFLTGLAAAALPRASWAQAGYPAFLSAGRQGADNVLHGLDAQGSTLFALPLPARGHAAAAHPHQPLAVAFARRPGTYALVIDCRDGRVHYRLTPPAANQFNGHGAFSADGALLMTSEVVAETSEGRIGLWETAGYRRIGEWSSGGIGPHEIRRLPSGALMVANGGIATDPTDRRKLNLDRMRPNLSLIAPDGALADQAELPPELHQNSLRHLALIPGGVACAMQWEGDPAEPVPLLAIWRPGNAVQLCPPRDTEMFAMQGYAGSIAATADRIAMTSPRGGVVMLFDMAGKPVASHPRADICGVAAQGERFLASDGSGALWHLGDTGLSPASTGGPQWDNHMVALA